MVRLVFTALDSPDLAVARVTTRAASGGHDICPSSTTGWSSTAPTAPIHLMAGGGRPPAVRWVFDRPRWERLVALAREAGASAVGDGDEIFDSVAPVDDDGQPER